MTDKKKKEVASCLLCERGEGEVAPMIRFRDGIAICGPCAKQSAALVDEAHQQREQMAQMHLTLVGAFVTAELVKFRGDSASALPGAMLEKAEAFASRAIAVAQSNAAEAAEKERKRADG